VKWLKTSITNITQIRTLLATFTVYRDGLEDQMVDRYQMPVKLSITLRGSGEVLYAVLGSLES